MSAVLESGISFARARRAHAMGREALSLAGDLLPAWDFLALLAAAHLASLAYAASFAAPDFDPAFWNSCERWALPMALLAPFLLFDRRLAAPRQPPASAAWLRSLALHFCVFIGLVLAVGFSTRQLDEIPRAWAGYWLAAGFALTLLSRALLMRAPLPLRIAIVGAGPVADRLIQHLRRDHHRPVEIVGVFDDRATRVGAVQHKPNGSVNDLIELGKQEELDWVLLAIPAAAEERVLELVGMLMSLSVRIGLCPQNLGVPLAHQGIENLGSGLSVLRLADRERRTIRIDDYDLERFAQTAAQFGQERFGYVVTPNADHLIRLHDDSSFRALYAQAGFVLMDSRFVARLLRVSRGQQLPVCTGSDLTERLLSQVVKPQDRVVLIGGGEDQALLLAQRYRLRRLAHFNPPMGFANDPAELQRCADFVEAHSPFRFCLLAVGSPQQERLASLLLARRQARGLALCVGASINFLTGVERRAPKWLQRAGLEWLYRLLSAPRRLATRYLVRGPRVFRLLQSTDLVLRAPRRERPAAQVPTPRIAGSVLAASRRRRPGLRPMPLPQRAGGAAGPGDRELRA